MFGSNLLQFPRGSGWRARIDSASNVIRIILSILLWPTNPGQIGHLFWMSRSPHIKWNPFHIFLCWVQICCNSYAVHLVQRNWLNIKGDTETLWMGLMISRVSFSRHTILNDLLCFRFLRFVLYGDVGLHLIAFFHKDISHIFVFVWENLSIGGSDKFEWYFVFKIHKNIPHI